MLLQKRSRVRPETLGQSYLQNGSEVCCLCCSFIVVACFGSMGRSVSYCICLCMAVHCFVWGNHPPGEHGLEY